MTDYITERPWWDTITTWYSLVDAADQRLIARRNQPLRSSGPATHFSDSEVISVSLIIETFFQGHAEVGYACVTQFLKDMFPDMIDLDRFNVRRRQLIAVIEVIRSGGFCGCPCARKINARSGPPLHGKRRGASTIELQRFSAS